MKNNKTLLFSEFVRNDYEKHKTFDKNIKGYASWIGVSHTVIHDMLNGKYDAPSPLTAARMCEWFCLDPEELCQMLTNADDKFIDELTERINGTGFADSCKNSISYFFKMHNSNDLFDEEPFDKSRVILRNYTVNELKFVNTDESSVYDGHSYNATANYTQFDIKPIGKKNNKELFKSEEAFNADFAIYYLPNRRVRKNLENAYPDEGFRDFSTKLFNIIKDPNAPRNNIFFTSSKTLYKSIVKYTKELSIICNNHAGVGIIYYQYKRPLSYHTIIYNDDLMLDDEIFQD